MSRWKKILFAIIFSLFLIPTLLVGLAFVFQDKIKAVLIEQVNKQIKVPIKVTGPITFSLLKDFPYASLSFENIEIPNVLKPKDSLLKIKRFSFLIQMKSLLENQIEVKKILLENGSLHLLINKNGIANYDIFKPSDSKNSKTLKLHIQEAILRNIDFQYENEITQFLADAKIQETRFSGSFEDAQFDLKVAGDFFANTISAEEEIYLAHKQINTDFVFQVNQNQSIFQIQKAALKINQNLFLVKGSARFGKQNSEVNFTAESKGDNIADLIELIPISFKSKLEGTTGKGNYKITALVAGKITDKLVPSIHVEALLSNASMKLPKVSKEITDIATKAIYHSDSLQNNSLTIQHFTSKIGSDPFQFNLALKQLKNPIFNFEAQGMVHLEELKMFFEDSVLENISGEILFEKFQLSGCKSDFQNVANSDLKAAGVCTLKDIEVKTKQVNYSHINGHLTFDNNHLALQNGTLHFVDSEIDFTGNVANLLPYIYAISQKKEMTGNLSLEGKLAVNTFDLSKVLSTFETQKSTHTHSKPIRDFFNLDGHLQISVTKFSYKKLQFKEVKALVSLSPYKINITDLTCLTMGGEIENKGFLKFTEEGDLQLECNLKIKGVEIPQLFQQCENFDQTTLTDKNLQGKINAELSFLNTWKDYKTVDFASLSAILKCSISRGELINFEPIKAASKFIDINELNHLKFAELKNELTIKNGVITVPMMEINSNAINLLLNGTHTFENEIDYHIKVNLNKILASKFDKRKANNEYIEEDPYQGLNLYLGLKGTLPNIKITYDKGSAKNKLKQDFVKEKEIFKNLFKKENSTNTPKEDKKEDKFFITKPAPEFIDFEEDK